MTVTKPGRLKVDPDLVQEPWWWEARNRTSVPEPDLPGRIDFAVVGGGYTGLSAAITLARAGGSVVVFDENDPGDGASTRNGGMAGNRLKPDFRTLARQFGEKKAVALVEEGVASLDFLEQRIIDNGIDCHFNRMGRFVGAVNRSHYESMAKDLEAEKAHREIDAVMVPAEEQSQFLRSPMYHGGRLHHDTGGVHPAKLHDGLLAAARSSGAIIAARTPVLGMEETDNGYQLETGLGFIEAGKVLVCTNGYTGAATPDYRSRVIPVTSAIIATEELDPGLVDQLIPGGRMITDTYNLLNYYRPSPDGKRILLGSRPTFMAGTDGPKLADYLGKRLGSIFPELDGVSISHCWSGKVAFAFDTFPKIGMDENIGYAMCYSGSGVAMSNWLGHKLAQKALGDLAGRTAFDDMEFPGRFYYDGWPWFMGPALAWYSIKDRLAGGGRR